MLLENKTMANIELHTPRFINVTPERLADDYINP